MLEVAAMIDNDGVVLLRAIQTLTEPSGPNRWPSFNTSSGCYYYYSNEI